MASLPEPPPNVPRIAEVQDPGTGHYVVIVRMPTQLAAKFPDKPWGTTIESIGLAKQDSDRFLGYTLVDVEPLKGSPDLYWIFQKLNGPVWTTKSLGQDSLIPAKYRRLVTTTRTKQEVTPDTEPDELAEDLISSVVEQEEDTGKAVKVNTTETINTDESPLMGELLNRYATVSTTFEGLVLDGEDLDGDDVSNYLVLKLSDTPLGNGKSVREKEVAESFPELTGYETDRRHNVSNKFTEQVVEATEAEALASPPDPLVEYNPMDKLRTLKRTIDLGTSLDDWKLSYATRVSLDLPRELISVGVVWNEQHSIGTQDAAFQRIVSGTNYSLDAKASDAASSAASITADLQVKYKDFATGNLMGQRYVFFVKQEDATTEGILAKLNDIIDPDANPGGPPLVEMWPVFMPVSETITVKGQSINVRSNVSVGLNATRSDNVIVSRGWETGSSDDFSVGLTANSVQLPPCIHGDLSLQGVPSKSKAVAATAFMNVYHSDVGAAQVSKTKTGTAYGAVTPTSFEATGGQSTVPVYGLFVVDMDASPYDYGYVQVACTVFDAAILDPTPPEDP